MARFVHPLLLLVVVAYLVANVQATVRACDTKVEDLFDQEWNAYEERIPCEGSQFKDPTCSKFWLRQGRLLRSKLTRELCEEKKDAPYYKYFEKIFFKIQNATSTSVNATGSALRASIQSEYETRRERVEFLWNRIREELTALFETQWSNTRTEGSLDEQATRDLVRADYGLATRDFVSERADGDRTFDGSENNNTRNFDTVTESGTRAHTSAHHHNTRAHGTAEETSTRDLASSEHADIRALWDSESDNTESTVSNAASCDAIELRNTVAQEETATRELVSATGADTQDTVRDSESDTISVLTGEIDTQKNSTIAANSADASQTQATVLERAQSDRDAATAAQASVENAFGNLVSTILALLDQFLVGLNEQERATFLNLLQHINLQAHRGYGWGDSILKLSPIELFQRPGEINTMRSIVNETIVFNRAKYGNDNQANNAWNNAEDQRQDGDLRGAARSYRLAYIYAATP